MKALLLDTFITDCSRAHKEPKSVDLEAVIRM